MRKVHGKGSRDKGSRAERKVRDILRSIYPPESRSRVYRIPLSGAGAIKGDVADLNDPDSCYEVKCQEQLQLHEWWRQTKRQAGASRTPILVVTQSYRPYYFILRETDWFPRLDDTEFEDFRYESRVHPGRGFFDELANLGARVVGTCTLDDDPVVVISETFYKEVKTCEAERRGV